MAEEKKKLESTFVNMVLVLTVISLISALALGFTYNQTKPYADKVKAEKLAEAIKAVVPEFDELGEPFKVDGFERLELYHAKKGGEIVGTAVKSVSDKGFSGDVWVMVGFDSEGKVYNTAILEHKETPGLGTKMTVPAFKEQVNGKDPGEFKLAVKKDGGEVDAITAATISSRAFCDAVQVAYDAMKKGGDK
jgi:Na+-translocating ferredoxin:NAD+ oxidoreductase subunit G